MPKIESPEKEKQDQEIFSAGDPMNSLSKKSRTYRSPTFVKKTESKKHSRNGDCI